jgi:hypothetical protein
LVSQDRRHLFVTPCLYPSEPKDRDDIPLLLGVKVVLNWFEWNLPGMEWNDWLLVEVTLMLIDKIGFNHPSVMESPLKLSPQQ